MFRAILLEKDDEGLVTTRLQELPKSRLPEGDVTVAIEYTTVNYKDGALSFSQWWRLGAHLSACGRD